MELLSANDDYEGQSGSLPFLVENSYRQRHLFSLGPLFTYKRHIYHAHQIFMISFAEETVATLQ